MRQKRFLPLSLAILLLMSVMQVTRVSAQGPEFRFDPPEVPGVPGAPPGRTFTVDVIISSVADMDDWEFTFRFHPGVIQCLGASIPDDDPRVKFVDGAATNNTRYDDGETVVYDNDGDGLYDIGELTVEGTTPGDQTLVLDDPLIKYIDANNNGVWDLDRSESLVFDRDGDGMFDQAERVFGFTPTPRIFADYIYEGFISPAADPLTIKRFITCDNEFGIVSMGATQLVFGDLTIAGADPVDGSDLMDDFRIRFEDLDGSSTWSTDFSESVVYDADNSTNFTAGDTVIAGPTPAIDSTLVDDPLIKFQDSNGNGQWNLVRNKPEPVVYDILQSSSNKFNAPPPGVSGTGKVAMITFKVLCETCRTPLKWVDLDDSRRGIQEILKSCGPTQCNDINHSSVDGSFGPPGNWRVDFAGPGCSSETNRFSLNPNSTEAADGFLTITCIIQNFGEELPQVADVWLADICIVTATGCIPKSGPLPLDLLNCPDQPTVWDVVNPAPRRTCTVDIDADVNPTLPPGRGLNLYDEVVTLNTTLTYRHHLQVYYDCNGDVPEIDPAFPDLALDCFNPPDHDQFVDVLIFPP